MKRPISVALASAGFVLSLFGAAVSGPLEDGLTALLCNDNTIALRLLRPLAEGGNVTAQGRIGVMYLNGLGVPRNEGEAVSWLRKAYRRGDGISGFILSEMGQLTSTDKEELKHWCITAANQGDANAEYRLAIMYETGEGMTRDPAEALHWMRKAAEQGLSQAQSGLGKAYFDGDITPANHVEAALWFGKSAEQGEMFAQERLGDLYFNGDGVTQNYVTALKWYIKAAEQGDEYSKDKAAVMYALGQGVPQDYVQALMWFDLTGLPMSQNIKADLVSKMTPAQIADAARQARQRWSSRCSPKRFKVIE